MVYKQLAENCFGGKLISHDEFRPILADAQKFLAEILDDKLPIFTLAAREDDLAEIENFAAQINSKFKNLVVLGTGGSVLCPAALVGFRQSKFSSKVIIHDNIDPTTFADFFAAGLGSARDTAFLTISKSGESIETISQLLYCLQESGAKPTENFFSITTPGSNTLRDLSKKLGIKTFDHAPKVGGRFSIFSLVGLMPAAVSGVDIRKLRAGAQKFLQTNTALAAESAALHIAFMRKNIWQNVLMTYPDRLCAFNSWYRQIWAESTGKNSTGSTPIKARGTIDQHSQMQNYLGGRKDKFYNFITLNFKSHKKLMQNIPSTFSYLKEKSLADVINAEQKATIETLVHNQRPVRVIEIDALDEENLGMLTAHLMLETIITARLLGVNPFDQPAVEEGKIKTRAALKF